MEFRQVQLIGGKGSERGKFTQSLTGLCIGRDHVIYAAGDSQVCVYDAAGKPGRAWRCERPAHAVAVRGDGAVYAGEPGQIEIFDASGKLTATWSNTGDITAIGFFGDQVLAADSTDRCICRYDSAGRLINKIGKNRMGGFLIPNGSLDFSVDAGGIIHAANPGKHRVERYTCAGELLGHIGRFDGNDPAGFSGCCNPTNVTLGGHSRVYVTEKAGPRAKVMDEAGNLLGVIATNAFHPMCKNMAIAVDSRDRVYVADTVKLHIVVFEAEGAL